ncbi:MAG: hypothetical protein QF704_04615, partial [Anaerolineales bacterium]|nr:hypothetical protein [Anaerolineales bacterium]
TYFFQQVTYYGFQHLQLTGHRALASSISSRLSFSVATLLLLVLRCLHTILYVQYPTSMTNYL